MAKDKRQTQGEIDREKELVRREAMTTGQKAAARHSLPPLVTEGR